MSNCADSANVTPLLYRSKWKGLVFYDIIIYDDDKGRVSPYAASLKYSYTPVRFYVCIHELVCLQNHWQITSPMKRHRQTRAGGQTDRLTPTHTHTHSQGIWHTHTHTHTDWLTQSHTSHRLYYTQVLCISISLSHIHTHTESTHSHTDYLCQTYIQALSLSLSLCHTHTHTHIQKLSLSHKHSCNGFSCLFQLINIPSVIFCT